MRIRIQDSNGDFTFGSSQNNFYINSPQGVGQAVQDALLLFLGEWYLDNSIGVPYMQGILGKHSQAEADATIQSQVLQVDNVVDITNFQSTIDPNTRAYSCSFDLDTVFGTTSVQMANYLNY